MRVSEHLAQFHKAAHSHHLELIEAHEAAVEKAAGMEDAPQKAFHKSAVQSHEKMRDFHESALEECQKAAAASGGATYVSTIVNRGGHLAGSDLPTGDLDGPRTSKAAGRDDAIVPDRVSGILTPIPRTGQRELQKMIVPMELDNILEAID